MEQEIKDLVIIGSGPSGLSAAVYGKRAMLNEVVIEKDIYGGGQIAVTDRVDNYLGLYGENGYDLAMKFKNHAEQLEVPFIEDEVLSIKAGAIKEVVLASGQKLLTKAICISTGASHKTLNCKGEKEFAGVGVSYCATCDGAFYKKKKVAVVGGGDVALQDALYLSNICEKVYLIHRREELRGAKVLQNKVFETDNIEFMPNEVIEEISGKAKVEEITIRNTLNNEIANIQVSGVFIAIGMNPNSSIAKGIVELDKTGYIIADETCRTNIKGIYAIGDVRTKQLRQVVTAVSDGAMAITSIENDY